MVKLYTIGCPACIVLQKKLIAKDVQFALVTNEAAFEQLNIEVFPMMQIDDGPLMDFQEAIAWVNKLGV